MKRRVLSLVLTLAMLATVFSGCSKSEPTQPSNAGTGTPTATQAPTQKPLPPLELDIMVVQQVNADLSDNIQVIQELEKRTNTKLNYTNIPQADIPQKVQTLAAANKLPDIVNYPAGIGGTSPAEYAGNGIFVKFQDIFNKPGVAPNIKKLWEKYPDLKKNSYDEQGNLYTLYSTSDRVWYCDLMINNTWLQEIAKPVPTTLDEFYQVLKAFKEKHPDGVPFGVGAYAGGPNAVKFPIMYSYNVTSEFWLYPDGQYMYGPYEKQNEYKAALTYLNKLYSEKLIDESMFSIQADEINKLVSTSKVGAFYTWDDAYLTVAKGMSWNVDYVPVPPLKGPDGKGHGRASAGVTQQNFYITKSCDDVERTLQFVDYCFSDAGIDLLNWGIEGVHYKTENGKRTFTDLILKNQAGAGIGRYQNALGHPRMLGMSSGAAEMAVMNPLTSKAQEYLLASEKFPAIPRLAATPEESKEYSAIFTDIAKYVSESEAKFIRGTANLTTDFDTFIKTLESMNVKRAIEIKKAQYDRYKKK